VARVSARYGVGIEDLWNEAIAALLRVSIHRAENAHEIRAGDHYCRTAIHRACWRYVVRDHLRRQRQARASRSRMPLDLSSSRLRPPRPKRSPATPPAAPGSSASMPPSAPPGAIPTP
jgi:hypothetical protein